MKIKASYIALLLFVLLMAACSDIAEEDRLIYVKPAPVQRSVLIEDFTGQMCINCPTATQEIEKLIEQYGEDVIIAVGIHSGPLGFHTRNNLLGLSTDLGDAYYNHWNLPYQPIGLIDRGAPTEYTAWGTQVRQELQKTAPVDIDLSAILDDNLNIAITTQLMGVDGNTLGKLQLWIVEDSINTFQRMPDGTRNNDYIHNHVFRAAVNGDWGEDITVNEGYSVELQHSIAVASDWNPENLSVIAFVYNERGVLQVTKTKLLSDPPEVEQ